MPIIVLAPTLALAQTMAADVTVEAEYGTVVVEGAVYTAAHHQPNGPYAGRHIGGPKPSPCNDPEIPVMDGGVILVSHVDLDTFGGCFRAMGADVFEVGSEFWGLAEFVDTSGPHKLVLSGASDEDLRRLYAFWAWSKTNVPRFPRDSVTDITEVVNGALVALRAILDGDPDLLSAGDAFRAADADLNRRTFKSAITQPQERVVVVRVAEAAADFCNHLYATPDGIVGDAVVCYNTATGAVTVSLADPIPGVSCRDIVQDLWGPEAGGHAGIAGSPRGVDVGAQGLEDAIAHLQVALL